jgi:hypothetical protein
LKPTETSISSLTIIYTYASEKMKPAANANGRIKKKYAK